eukprot:TRINITY_DN1371_c0_g3_i3.p1 TRINITY_DN1371_c0_g3~~TRINITY_DN1371_c0_g3_i3.p1  ORF type:complete len:568 (+),score=136.54 TRINITY_DN1371_c0_g3_i3:33-1706(+)
MAPSLSHSLVLSLALVLLSLTLTNASLPVVSTSGSYWNSKIDGASVHPDSDSFIAQGGNKKLYIDFSTHLSTFDSNSIEYQCAPLNQASDYGNHCSNITLLPYSQNGALSGETTYTCTNGGDCRYFVHDASNGILYETTGGGGSLSSFDSECTVVWDLTTTYPNTLRGSGCAGADGSGMPVSNLLLNLLEVQDDAISHALRFSLPRGSVQSGVHFLPAQASDPAANGPAAALPTGSRLRLRADFDADSLSPEAQIIVVALKTYGIYLAEAAGNLFSLTAQSQRGLSSTWELTGDIDETSLNSILLADFELVSSGSPVADEDCQGASPPVSTDCLAEVDCERNEWSDFSPCVDGSGVEQTCAPGGTHTHTATLKTPAAYGGSSNCPLTQTLPCNTQPCDTAPASCVPQPWGEWNACSASCGGGTRERSRANLGQGECEVIPPEVEACNEQACVSQTDCVMDEWGPYSECSCSSSLRTRSRTVLVTPSANGLPCPSSTETDSCECSGINSQKTGLEDEIFKGFTYWMLIVVIAGAVLFLAAIGVLVWYFAIHRKRHDFA